jgi:hypothetical protein
MHYSNRHNEKKYEERELDDEPILSHFMQIKERHISKVL